MNEAPVKDDPIALTLLTGFLGAGKTTLLNRVLAQPAMGRCAVVVNEVGAIGLDHLLLGTTRDATIALLENGCLCCGVRGELSDTLDALLARRARGEIPAFERVWVETTGLARPGPVLSELLGDERLDGRLALDGVIAVVDGVQGARQLERHEEARQQVACADRLLITKADLADAGELAALDAALAALNPFASRHPVLKGEVDVASLLGMLTPRTLPRWLGVARQPLALRAVRRVPAGAAASREAPAAPAARTGLPAQRLVHPDIATFTLGFDMPLPADAVEQALTVLLAYHGERVLRVKGICAFAGETAPVVLHGVQQLLHEPLRLDSWPDDERRSRIVFIVQGLPRQVVIDTFAHFGCQPETVAA
ncbi:CobW family GTP-binding protein [Paraburkholderia ferrariae]|uniref:CobW family GTP-binding protein n=1 Tax=Paraburkholderia ferrariae TaxID=386056 RepID=UPI0004810C8B|nr:GTP-binding protein [Paraburkholderia ferrariae]